MAVTAIEFEKALGQLKVALQLFHSEKDEMIKAALRDAVIQRFEFSVELAWKCALKKLGLPAQAPKPAVREMAQAGLITDVTAWFNFIEARNKSSHTYAEEVAEEVMAVIPNFVAHGEILLLKIKL